MIRITTGNKKTESASHTVPVRSLDIGEKVVLMLLLSGEKTYTTRERTSPTAATTRGVFCKMSSSVNSDITPAKTNTRNGKIIRMVGHFREVSLGATNERTISPIRAGEYSPS